MGILHLPFLRMKRFFKIFAGLLTVSGAMISCAQSVLAPEEPAAEQAFYMNVTGQRTRTVFEGGIIKWKTGDGIGMFVGDKVVNKKFTCVKTDEVSSSFVGYYVPVESMPQAKMFAYYPYSEQTCSDGKLHLNLPEKQAAPYEPVADFILADAVRDYDKSNPNLDMSFDRHVFSIVKLNFTNTDDMYSEEEIRSVEIIAPEGSVLAGNFSIDISDGKAAEPVFAADGASDRIEISYPEESRPVLGKGSEHVIYAVVNAGTYSGLRVVVNGSVHKSSFTSSGEICLKPDTVHEISGAFDFASGRMDKSHKTLLYWGDSIANETVTSYLQTLLGSGWTVVRGGIGGDSPLGIAGRQGSIPLIFKDNLTIPGDGSEVQVGRLYSSWTQNGEPGDNTSAVSFDAWFQPASHGALINDCYVGEDKVECQILYNIKDGKNYIHRVYAGEDVSVTDGTVLYSNASQKYPHPDVTCVYMGANRGYNDSYPALARMYSQMKTRACDEYGRNNFIAIGFHMAHVQFTPSYEYTYWTPEYRDFFQFVFGEQYLDLKTAGGAGAERISKAVGSPYTEEDAALAKDGCWPASWQTDYVSNVHPNAYGSKALAFMVYEKMKSLGYLD